MDQDSVGFLRIGIRLVFQDRDQLVFLVWIFGFLKDLDVLFFGIRLFRLLIQRCKNVTGRGNLFDQGEVWPDESGICATNGMAD